MDNVTSLVPMSSLIVTRSDILQGQALFIRVKQKNLFCFRTSDRKTDIQKRQKGRNDRQAEKTDKQKRQTGRNDIKTQQTLTENTEGQKRKT